MAQVFPRYCPRCGTPTRENMRLCPTCGLSVANMLRHPQNQPSSQNGGPQEPQPKPARVVPPPRPGQQQNQPYRSARPPAPQNVPSRRMAPNPQTNNKPGSWSEQGSTLSEPLPPSPLRPPATRMTPNPQTNKPGSWPEQGPTLFEPLPPSPLVPPEIRNMPNPQGDKPGSWSEQDGTLAASIPPLAQAPRAPLAEPIPLSARVSAPRPQGKRRMAIVLMLLAGLLVLGAGGYLAFAMLGGQLPGLAITQAPIKTANLNIPVTYAGLDITLLSAQQAQNFIDDPHTVNNGMLRLNIKEQNTTTVKINWDYMNSAHLLVSGQTAVAPVYVQSKGTIAPGATQTSMLDFAVPNGGNLNQISLQLGTANEAQMQIPLAGQTNLSQYQPKTRQQHGSMVYFGLNWTLTSSTASLSIPGQQAAKGMTYLTLTLKVDNTLSQQAITGSPFDYLRIKTGGKTLTPINTTLPVSFATGEMGKTGTVTFLIPQNSPNCTLLLLSQDPGGSGQASTDFQPG